MKNSMYQIFHPAFPWFFYIPMSLFRLCSIGFWRSFMILMSGTKTFIWCWSSRNPCRIFWICPEIFLFTRWWYWIAITPFLVTSKIRKSVIRSWNPFCLPVMWHHRSWSACVRTDSSPPQNRRKIRWSAGTAWPPMTATTAWCTASKQTIIPLAMHWFFIVPFIREQITSIWWISWPKTCSCFSSRNVLPIGLLLRFMSRSSTIF